MKQFELSVDGLRKYRDWEKERLGTFGVDELMNWAISEILSSYKKWEFYKGLLDQIGGNASPGVTDVLRVVHELAGEKDAVERKLLELETENKSIRKSLGREREKVARYDKCENGVIDELARCKKRVAEFEEEVVSLNRDLRCARDELRLRRREWDRRAVLLTDAIKKMQEVFRRPW